MDDTLVLGGRKFSPAQNFTFAHHIWLMNHVHAAGLDEAAPERDFVGRMLSCGRVTQLLAGSLIEEGQPWSEQSAEENARFFAGLSDPADITALSQAMTGVLLGFFLNAGGLSATFPSSSSLSEGSTPDGESEAVSSSETGQSSSESSPAGIPTEPERS